MKTRRTRLVSRGKGARDARLFIIAAEGDQTERQYFEGLQRQGVIDRRRVVIEVLSHDDEDDGRSAPRHVIERLDEFKRRHEFNEEIDQLWLVLDCDHWTAPSHIHNLTDVIQRAQQKRYRVAVSNPCFELWLLLHFTEDIDGIRSITLSRACQACQQRIRELCGSYNKSKIRAERYTEERVKAAIRRARALDTNPDDRWPQSTGTHVYRLAQELLEQSRRNAPLPRQGRVA